MSLEKIHINTEKKLVSVEEKMAETAYKLNAMSKLQNSLEVFSICGHSMIVNLPHNLFILRKTAGSGDSSFTLDALKIGGLVCCEEANV